MLTLVTPLLLLLLAIPFTLSLDCYPPPSGTQLPLLDHCQELVYALTYASQNPRENIPKEWGRGLPSTDFTEYLPKQYWLPGRGPQTCALSLDADPLHPNAREVFKLEDIAHAARRIVNICLIRRQIGRDFLGRTGQVVAKLRRTDSPRVIQASAGEVWRGSVVVPGIGWLVWMDKGGNGSLAELS
ncbi:MAG: hypothetical protein Q9186_006614 [Xanthomendoza sp. 1 TL-2023]